MPFFVSFHFLAGSAATFRILLSKGVYVWVLSVAGSAGGGTPGYLIMGDGLLKKKYFQYLHNTALRSLDDIVDFCYAHLLLGVADVGTRLSRGVRALHLQQKTEKVHIGRLHRLSRH